MPPIDISNKRYGRLTAKSVYDKKNREIRWLCICDCGKEAIVFGTNLRKGHTKSCGCIEVDRPNATTHGLRHHPLYRIWKSIKARCYNKNIPIYKFYGAKGITMCDEWLKNPKAFVSWAMENGWRKGLKIDKDKKPLLNNEIPTVYSPETCSILTHKENTSYTKRSKKFKNVYLST